jgi:hypothetical protein
LYIICFNEEWHSYFCDNMFYQWTYDFYHNDFDMFLAMFCLIFNVQWCGFKSHRGKNKNLTALKSNSNTVWFNFQTYIYIYIYIIIIIKKLPLYNGGKHQRGTNVQIIYIVVYAEFWRFPFEIIIDDTTISDVDIDWCLSLYNDKWHHWDSIWRTLGVRLSEWCCSVSMAWVQIPSREEQKFDRSKI